MKVCHIITRLATGGAQEMVLDISSHLLEIGVDVEILTGISSDKTTSGNNNRLFQEAINKKIKIVKIPHLSNNFSFVKDVYVIFWLIRYMKLNNNSIFHIHSSKVGILARLAGFFAGSNKVIFHVHGWSFSRYTGAKRYFYFQIEYILSYITSLYVFVCNSDYEEINSKRLIKNYKIIYPSIDERIFNESKHDLISDKNKAKKTIGFEETTLLIGSIGRMDEQKNPLDFIHIANEIKKKNINCKLIWVGDGTLEPQFRSQLEVMGLSNRVFTPGFVKDTEDFYKAIDIFIITSKYEGLPVSAIKAIVSGAYVVGYKVNGMRDLDKIFSSVYCTDIGDINGVVDTITRIIIDKKFDKLEQSRSCAFKIMSKKKMMTDLISAYNEMN